MCFYAIRKCATMTPSGFWLLKFREFPKVQHLHKLCVFLLTLFFASGFLELSADLNEAAVAHCQLIVVSK